jgi:arylsulfatase A-like enzyme
MSAMRRLVLAAAAALALVASTPGADASGSPTKPNVVVILADDLGWTDLGCQGSKYYESPAIDRMAAGGLRCTSGYTCGPNCQPTRAALMAGQYGPRTGVYTVGGIDRFNWRSRPLRPVDNVVRLSLDKVTYGQALKAAGYATGYFGKWHLGQQGAYHPGKRGFDEALTSMGKHFDFVTQPPTTYPPGTYLADFLCDKTVDFIRRHQDGPFYVELAHFAVHAPHEAKADLIAKFKPKPPAGGHRDPVYAAMIASVDESVARVLAVLDELHLAENTLVVFTSDNGGVGGYRREGITKGNDVTDNAPLRSGKGSLYEGGVRVPYVFRWPGHVPPGTVTDTPIISVDLYPTLLELAQAKPQAAYPLDGVSYLKLLTSGGTADLGRDVVYWHFPGYLGAGQDQWRTTPAGSVRRGDWKLLEFFEDMHVELYNLKADLGERTNLAAAKPALAKELTEKLHAWRAAVGAKMPTANVPK